MSGDSYRIGMLVPFQGPGGIFGPSCVAVSEQAKNEVNQHWGIGGRLVELVYIDAGQRPEKIVAEVAQLLESGRLDAVTGWHISSIRKLLVPVLRNRIPYVYTSLSEGDAPTPGVYLIGENPEQQIFPALKWMREHLGHRRWHVIGASYIWPVKSLEKTALAAGDLGLEIVGSTLVKMGQGSDPLLPHAVAASGCDAVLILLVGQDAVDFNRSFAAAGLHQSIARYSPLMEENMLLASGPEATDNLYSSASYFRTLTSPAALDFLGRYVATQGVNPPALNNMAQSCYQGIYTLAELSKHTQSTDIADFNRNIDDLVFDSPRGSVMFRNNQAIQSVNIARADGVDFDVLGTLKPTFK
ncbi:substrate-binding domain-containing protein [Corynebacterium sp. A21]|uniref:substrate-binding domain-containing protein n=1 Tax=Corynebacterium sp. A21 TaxID=3457318 RepID=UPI003FD12D24